MQLHSVCKLIAGAVLLALPLGVTASEAASVTVEFVEPEKFSDVRDRRIASTPERNPHLGRIRSHLEKRAAGYLAPGQTLTVSFTDIDLAGDIQPHLDPHWRDVRIVSRVYPPRLDLRFRLIDVDGVEIRSGDVELRDLGFLEASSGRRGGTLHNELRMLDKWLRSEFGAS